MNNQSQGSSASASWASPKGKRRWGRLRTRRSGDLFSITTLGVLSLLAICGCLTLLLGGAALFHPGIVFSLFSSPHSFAVDGGAETLRARKGSSQASLMAVSENSAESTEEDPLASSSSSSAVISHEDRIAKAFSCHTDGYASPLGHRGGGYGGASAHYPSSTYSMEEHHRPHLYYDARAHECVNFPQAAAFNDYDSYTPPSDPTMVPLLSAPLFEVGRRNHHQRRGGSGLNADGSNVGNGPPPLAVSASESRSSLSPAVKVRHAPSIHSRWLLDSWRLWEGEFPCGDNISALIAEADRTEPHSGLYADTEGRHPSFDHGSYATKGSHKSHLPGALYELESFCIDEDDSTLYTFVRDDDEDDNGRRKAYDKASDFEGDGIEPFEGITEHFVVGTPTVIRRLLSIDNRRVVPLVMEDGDGEHSSRRRGGDTAASTPSSSWQEVVKRSLAAHFSALSSVGEKRHSSSSSSSATTAATVAMADVLFVDRPALIAAYGAHGAANPVHSFHRIAPFMSLSKLLGVRTILFAVDIVGNGVEHRFTSQYRRVMDSTDAIYSSYSNRRHHGGGGGGVVDGGVSFRRSPPTLAPPPAAGANLNRYQSRFGGSQAGAQQRGGGGGGGDQGGGGGGVGYAQPTVGKFSPPLYHLLPMDLLTGEEAALAPPGAAAMGRDRRHHLAVGGARLIRPTTRRSIIPNSFRIYDDETHHRRPEVVLRRDAVGRLGGAFMPFAHQLGPVMSSGEDNCEAIRCRGGGVGSGGGGDEGAAHLCSPQAINEWRRCSRRFTVMNVALPVMYGEGQRFAPDTQGYSASVWNRALKASSREAKRLRHDIWVAKEQMVLRSHLDKRSRNGTSHSAEDSSRGQQRRSSATGGGVGVGYGPSIAHYEWYIAHWRARLIAFLKESYALGPSVPPHRSHTNVSGAGVWEQANRDSKTRRDAEEVVGEYMEEYFATQLEIHDLRERGLGGEPHPKGGGGGGGGLSPSTAAAAAAGRPKQLICYRSAYIAHNHLRQRTHQGRGTFRQAYRPSCSEVETLSAVRDAGLSHYGMCAPSASNLSVLSAVSSPPFSSSPFPRLLSINSTHRDAHPLFTLPSEETQRLRRLFTESKGAMADVYRRLVVLNSSSSPLAAALLSSNVSLTSLLASPVSSRGSLRPLLGDLMRRIEVIQNAYDDEIMRYFTTSSSTATTNSGGAIGAQSSSSSSSSIIGRKIALHFAMRSRPSGRPQPHLRRTMSLIIPSLEQYVDFNIDEGQSDGLESEKDFERHIARMMKKKKRKALGKASSSLLSSSSSSVAHSYTPFRNTRSVQFHRFITTDLFIGPHGADLHGIAYAKPSALALELSMPALDRDNKFEGGYFSQLAYARGVGYLRVAGHTKEIGGNRERLTTYLSVAEYRHAFAVATCSWLAMNAVRLTDEEMRMPATTSGGHDDEGIRAYFSSKTFDHLVPWWCRGGAYGIIEELRNPNRAAPSSSYSPHTLPSGPAWDSPNHPQLLRVHHSSVSDYMHRRNARSAFGFAVPICPPLAGTAPITQQSLNRLQNECARMVTAVGKGHNATRHAEALQGLLEAALPVMAEEKVEKSSGGEDTILAHNGANISFYDSHSSSQRTAAAAAALGRLLAMGALPFLNKALVTESEAAEADDFSLRNIALSEQRRGDADRFIHGVDLTCGDYHLGDNGLRRLLREEFDDTGDGASSCGRTLIEWSLHPRLPSAASMVAERTLRFHALFPEVFDDVTGGSIFEGESPDDVLNNAVTRARRGGETSRNMKTARKKAIYVRAFLRGLMVVAARELGGSKVVDIFTPSPLFVLLAAEVGGAHSAAVRDNGRAAKTPMPQRSAKAIALLASLIISNIDSSSSLFAQRQMESNDALQRRRGRDDDERELMLVRDVLGLCVPTDAALDVARPLTMLEVDEAGRISVVDVDRGGGYCLGGSKVGAHGHRRPDENGSGSSAGDSEADKRVQMSPSSPHGREIRFAVVTDPTLRFQIAGWIFASFADFPAAPPLAGVYSRVDSDQFSYGWKCAS